MKNFEDYIDYRVRKWGEKERLRFKKVEENLFSSNEFLAINGTISLSNVGFYFVCSNNGKFYYRNK